MDLKEIRSLGLVQRLQESAWPCGHGSTTELKTGVISSGLTCLVSTALLTLYFVEDYLANHGFSNNVIAVCVVSMFLILADIALLFGAVNKISSLLVPWMVIHTSLEVFLIIYFGVRFSWMAGYRTVSLASFALLAYFILIVFLHYKQLTAAAKETPRKNGGGHRPIIKNAATSDTTAIDMEVVNGNPVVSTSAATAAAGSCGLDVDDTFTAIASRDVSGAAGASAGVGGGGILDDSGEFAVPASATGSKTFSFPPQGGAPIGVGGEEDAVDGKPLPEPVEVIEVAAKPTTVSSTNPFLQDLTNLAGPFGPTPTLKKSFDEPATTEDDEARECLLEAGDQSESEGDSGSGKQTEAVPHVAATKRNASKGHLVDLSTIDNTFTPFKPKKSPGAAGESGGAEGEEELPKMKVFLPGDGAADDDDSDDASSTAS